MQIEQKIKQTLGKIKLSKKERIIVALSGGKDSTVTAYFLKKLGYNIGGFHIDLGLGEYSDRCLKAVEDLCKQLEIKLNVYDFKKEMGSGMCYLRGAIQSKQSLKNCAICGVIKKWILNKEVRKLKADKIATGHNLDDEAQTFLINIFKGSPELSSNSGPISKNTMDKKFVPRIKPLFYVPEEEIRKYSKKKKLPVVYEKCPCALDSYRLQVRKFTEGLSDEKKMNIINNMDKMLANIQRNKDSSKDDSSKDDSGEPSGEPKVNYCELCGEPSRKEVCKMCQLMRIK